MDGNTLTMAALSQGLFKIFLVIVALVAARLMVMWMDKYLEDSSSNFAEWFKETSDEVKVTYYAARWIGVCLAIAGAVG
jgi:hypothetical protein